MFKTEKHFEEGIRSQNGQCSNSQNVNDKAETEGGNRTRICPNYTRNQYIIDGIPDDTNNKIKLYGARKFEEFLRKNKVVHHTEKQNHSGNVDRQRRLYQKSNYLSVDGK